MEDLQVIRLYSTYRLNAYWFKIISSHRKHKNKIKDKDVKELELQKLY